MNDLDCIQLHSEWATRFRLVCLDIVEVSKSAEHILRFVKEQHLEGVVAKRADGIYLPGKRTGLARRDGDAGNGHSIRCIST